MKVYTEFTEFYDLIVHCWGGALQTLQTIIENGKESELMNLLEELTYANDGIGITELNDFLSFEDDYIFECLDISEN